MPTGQAGARLIAFTALLMACFRQSKRRAAQFLSMILNQPASAGWMVLLQNRAAEAVKPAYDELAEQLAAQTVLNIDESPTKEGQAKAWVWTFVAATFTFFACRTSRAADVIKELLGAAFTGVIHCDRARMYWSFDEHGKSFRPAKHSGQLAGDPVQIVLTPPTHENVWKPGCNLLSQFDSDSAK